MASGSFNIDTFSYRHQLPLSNEYTAFSTGTMFAVGPSSFTQGYSFYDYSYGLCKFPDTSTLSVSLTTYIGNLVNYVSSAAVYNRVFNYTWPAVSTFQSTSTSPGNYPLVIDFPALNLSNATIFETTTVLDVIRSRAHNLVVDFTYNLSLNKSGEDFNWVSTLGYFGPFDINLQASRRQSITRVNVNQTYTTLTSRMVFNTASVVDYPAANFYSTFSIRLVSLSNTGISATAPNYSVFADGNYNYSFTFYPLASNIFTYPIV